MNFKKQLLIYPALFFLPLCNTTVWAAASTEQTTEKPVSTNVEAAEPSEKIEETTPFCSVNALLKSDFVRTSVWPGIGPFDPAAPNESADAHQSVKLSDPSHNQISYTTNGNEVSACELELHNSIGEAQGLLNLQMGTDFLLEGLGVKPRQIHIVNMELSKKGKLLTGNNYNPISVIVAPLTVSFQNLGKKEGTSNPLFRVAILNQGKSAEAATNKVGTEENKAGDVDIANVPESTSNPETQTTEKVEPKKESSSTTDETGPSTSSPSPTVDNQTIEPSAPSANPSPSKPLSANDTLKKQFLDLITNWQRIKKTAVRQHQTDELSQALAGKALVRQSDAIKWLASNHKYYEMMSQGATIEHFDALVPGKKYAVFAEVKEKSKYMDESTKQQLKETDDTYKVNYTIEKIGPHWLITDSTLIKQGTKKASNPSAKPKH